MTTRGFLFYPKIMLVLYDEVWYNTFRKKRGELPMHNNKRLAGLVVGVTVILASAPAMAAKTMAERVTECRIATVVTIVGIIAIAYGIYLYIKDKLKKNAGKRS